MIRLALCTRNKHHWIVEEREGNGAEKMIRLVDHHLGRTSRDSKWLMLHQDSTLHLKRRRLAIMLGGINGVRILVLLPLISC